LPQLVEKFALRNCSHCVRRSAVAVPTRNDATTRYRFAVTRCRREADLNSQYPPATAGSQFGYTTRADQIPDSGESLSIIFIDAREPGHKHAEPRHGASNLVVLKAPLAAHRGDRNRPFAPPPADRLRRFGLTSSLSPAFLHQLRQSLSAGRRETAAMSRYGASAVPGAVFRALAGEVRSLSTAIA
jgi:hypothetical protein